MIQIRERLDQNELARRGDEIYEKEIAPRLTPDKIGHYVLIDVRTGDYEIDADELTASDRLRTRRPNAEVWLRQIGSEYARRGASVPTFIADDGEVFEIPDLPEDLGCACALSSEATFRKFWDMSPVATDYTQ